MVLLGLLLLASSGAFIGLLIADNLSGGPEYQVTVLGNDLVRLDSLGIFLAGVALALVFCLGLAMIGASRRAVRRRGVPVRAAEPVERRAPLSDEVPRTSARSREPLRDDVPLPPGDARPTAEERAAEQGGREAAVRRAPRWRRGLHLFGH
ncbi:hypothetical protein [Streptomyces rubellomurinus]|uniref:Integral membrane protein n=1 Tax=Streptomyces sp. Y1 TaxID=3238634 RepID=A0AB39TUS8_9ACTN|nr:hypothetical protein [Streptomyces rubellomurinus]